MRSLLCLLCCLALSPAARSAHPITEGVDAIHTGGNPATLIVWEDATPLVVRDDGVVFAACVEIGRGRLVALGHGSFFSSDRADTPRFLRQAVAWAHDDERPPRVFGLSQERLDAIGLEATAVTGTVGDVDLGQVDVIVCSPQEWDGADKLRQLQRFAAIGGGIIVGECAWGQIQLGRAEDLDDLAANRMLTSHGLMFTERAESPGRSGVYDVDAERAPYGHVSDGLRALADGGGDRPALTALVVGEALRIAPTDGPLAQRARRISRSQSTPLSNAYASMAERPLTPESDPLARAMIDFDARVLSTTPPDRINAHPSADAFPGPYDRDATPVVHEIPLRSSGGAWNSTGLWARPGQIVRLRVPAMLEDSGVQLRIGAWLDPQSFPQRVRLAHASRAFDLKPGLGVIASPIGGPIYLQTPSDFDYDGPVTMRSMGAIKMVHYVHIETSVEDWNAMLADPSTPWCELESEHLVFTLPTDMVQGCDRPDVVMDHWERVITAMGGLNRRSPRHWPDGKYRIVADKKLSWGYMYCPADAPVVIPTTAADEMVDQSQYDAEGPHELWGHYHELGHAHQNPAWTFAGTGEVTVNIFTVYALHTVNGYPLDSEHLRTAPDVSWRRYQEHIANGAPFDKWKSDPFLALQTYAMLWHAFGFEPFRETFALYYTPDGPRPSSDDEKRDAFVRTFSEAVGRDLSGYFEAWGVPLGDAVGEDLSELEAWMPSAPE